MSRQGDVQVAGAVTMKCEKCRLLTPSFAHMRAGHVTGRFRGNGRTTCASHLHASIKLMRSFYVCCFYCLTYYIIVSYDHKSHLFAIIVIGVKLDEAGPE